MAVLSNKRQHMKMTSRIRQARQHAGLSQQELSERIGVTRGAVANWESDSEITPTVEHMIQLALLTGVNFEWLATGRDARNDDQIASQPVVAPEEFARDSDERCLLQLFREAPKQQRSLILDVVEVHARKRRA
ncbi:helix-turn-helix domain-containing protein [Pseudoxanthomonas beigongshangi]